MLRSLRAATLIAVPVLLFAGTLAGQERNDFWIPIGPADSLDATCFIPVTLPPINGYPVLLMVHGFGDSKESRFPSCSIYAKSDYMTIAYSVRGHGKSTGRSSIMSDTERHDLAAVIEYIKHLPHADSEDIGIIGGSQGGLHALWAAADRLHVRALSADAITPQWASDMFSNGSIRRTVTLLLQSPGVRYTAERDTLWTLLREDRYAELRTRFCRGRDLDAGRLGSSDLPLLQFLKWQDHYFSAEPGIDAFLRYAGPKKLYVGTQGHFSDEIDDEKYFQNSQITCWFDCYLKGINNAIYEEPRFTRSVSSLPSDSAGNFHWTRSGSDLWPAAVNVPQRLYLTADSSLSLRPPVGRNASALLVNRYTDTNYTFSEGYIEGFRGARFASIIPQQKIVFTSPVLDSEIVWSGVPVMNLTVKSDNVLFPLHLQIYETDSSGRTFFINRINYTARNWKKRSIGIIHAEGIPHAHRFSRGSRIRFVLTNLDVTGRKQLGEYPFVLPVFRNASVTIFFDKRHPSSIDLPCEGQIYFRPDR